MGQIPAPEPGERILEVGPGTGYFDAAFAVAVLGEVRGVLRSGGRPAVGEAMPEPHAVPFEESRSMAEAAGMRLGRRLGGRAAARFAARAEMAYTHTAFPNSPSAPSVPGTRRPSRRPARTARWRGL